MTDVKVPKEAVHALDSIKELLCNSVIGVYLYGSAVMGGLRNNSDVDVLVITNRSLSETDRRKLVDRLLIISGKTGYIGNADFVRGLEVTIVNRDDIVPWKYRPKKSLYMANGSGASTSRGISQNRRRILIWPYFSIKRGTGWKKKHLSLLGI